MTGVAIISAVVLIFVNGFFVGVEFAALGARRSDIDERAAAGQRTAQAAQTLQSRLSDTLGAAQLGITLASLLLGKIAEPAVAHLIEDLLHDLGVPERFEHTIAFAVALSIVAFFHMVVGEMVPKNVSIAMAERSLMWLALPMVFWVWLVTPLNWLLTVLSNLGLRVLGVEPKDELDGAVTSGELLTMVRESAEGGLIDDDDLTLLGAAVSFGERLVDEVMVPMSEVDAVPISASVAEVEHELVTTNHARLVVYEDHIENVRGFVHGKDLLALGEAARLAPMRQRMIRPMVRVPQGTALPEVLLAMRRTSILLGLVVDGSRAVGVVTLDNVLAELVAPSHAGTSGDATPTD